MINIEIDEFRTGVSGGVLDIWGSVSGLVNSASLGLSWSYYGDYVAGMPEWKENYIDGGGNYAYVDESNTSFHRKCADDERNENEYVVWITVRDTKDLSKMYAERMFLVAGGIVEPLGDTINHNPQPPRQNGGGSETTSDYLKYLIPAGAAVLSALILSKKR